MKYKKWFCLVLGSVAALLSAIAGVNWLVDPMLCFNHDFNLCERRALYNDVMQKTTYLVNRKPEIDTLLLGSSRMYFAPPHLWGENGFNYSLGSLLPVQYTVLLENVKKTSPASPRRIVLGIDFFGSSKSFAKTQRARIQDTRAALESATSYLSPGKSLLSLKLTKYSFRQIKDNLPEAKASGRYNWFFYLQKTFGFELHCPVKPDEPQKRKFTREVLQSYVPSYKRYIYDEDYKKIIEGFLSASGGAEVIAYVTPTATPLLEMLFSYPGRAADYERWLREVVSLFGGVWCFMGVNSVTLNPDLWGEPNHHFTEVDIYIRNRIKNTGEAPEDFGVFLTEDNITEYMTELKEKLVQLKTGKLKDPWKKYTED